MFQRIKLLADRAGQPAEVLEDYDNLSLNSTSRNFFLAEIHNKSQYLLAEATHRFEASALALNVEVQLCGGSDGKPPNATDFIGERRAQTEQRTGLAALEGFDDVSICLRTGSHAPIVGGDRAVADHRCGDR
jgi:hypothetical protein